MVSLSRARANSPMGIWSHWARWPRWPTSFRQTRLPQTAAAQRESRAGFKRYEGSEKPTQVHSRFIIESESNWGMAGDRNSTGLIWARWLLCWLRFCLQNHRQPGQRCQVGPSAQQPLRPWPKPAAVRRLGGLPAPNYKVVAGEELEGLTSLHHAR